jgi:endo-1,4-beta-xylanase
MTSRTVFRALLLSGLVAGLGCTAGSGSDPITAPQGIAIGALVGASSPIQNDFEDGTTQGWFPFGSPTVANSTDVAFSGTHSLLTTGRTATYMGPGVSIFGQVQAGASYKVSLAARLQAGQAPTTLQVTVQRSMSDGTQAYDTVVASTNVTADGWVTLAGNYSYTANNVTGLILYVQSASATASYYIDAFSLALGAPAPISYDFEDGTTNPFFAFGPATLANSTAVAFSGTHSLAITARGASYAGPGVNLQGQLTKGATYQVTMSVRMVAGQPASTLQATMQRTPTGGSATYDGVASASNVTDQAWVTMSAVYSFATDNSGLILYVQSSSGTGSFYLDAVSITQLAPPAGPPGNTTGATSSFESNTTEGWSGHFGAATVAPTTADAHGGSYSLLTTGRAGTYAGPAYDVTNVMFNGSRYNVSLWVKMAPGAENEQLRISLDRHLGSTETFHQVVGNTTVTSGAWVRLQATYDMALANTQVILYVESNAGTSSFYIDDFSITYVPPAIAETNIPSVFQTLASYFPIGTAVLPADIQGQPGVLLAKHFNSMTSGNDMKWDATEPSEGNFTFTQADAEVAFATANNMRVRGHTLVWYQQTPAWVFNDASGNPLTPSDATRALLIQRLQNHITNVMQHFGSAVATWDVVNEPIDETQTDGLRRNNWYNLIGPDYIAIALNAARAASPTAKLYINDYNTTIAARQAALLTLVNNLKAAGVPLDGIGHQMHSNVEFPSPQSLIDTVNAFNATGVEQSITEMDVSIYSGSFPTPFTSYTDIPQSRHIMVGYSYSGFFQALKSLKGKIASVTIWGTSDDKTWLNSSTKIDAPLLFDPSLQHKYAYWGVVDPLQLPGADLSTTMTATPSVVPAGQAISYGITVTNNTDQNQAAYDPTDDDLPAANVTMTVAVPAHTSFQAMATPSGWTCNPPNAAGQITCTIASLAAGASAQFGLTVALNDCSTHDGLGITASASVSSTTADPNPQPNNSATASIQVSNPPPVITANGALATTLECHTPYTELGATALDACDGSRPVSIAGTVNSNAVGTYPVTYSAADSAGNQATPVVRTVTVADTTPPVITANGALVTTLECHTPYTELGATALDACNGSVPVSIAGTVNANVVGTYPVTYSAADNTGNQATPVVRTVGVSDTTPPTLTAGPSITMWSPDHSYHTFAMTDLVAAASDTCDGSVGIGSVVITQVTSDEPDNGNGDGNTINDIVIAPDCHSVQLRAERAGPLNGRVYHVTLRVKDASGNTTTAVATETVPLSTSSGPAIDDGVQNTVLSACH